MEAGLQIPITDINQLSSDNLYTYADYLKWRINERVELIKGRIVAMSPAPNTSHQRISRQLAEQIAFILQGKPCEYFTAPFDVRLKNAKRPKSDDEFNTVVQPDLCIICDPSKLDEKGCVGSPDLMVKILSPTNSKKEMGVKFDLYLENGIPEYWIVDPGQKAILVYRLTNGYYINERPLTEDDEMKSFLFPELKFLVGDIF